MSRVLGMIMLVAGCGTDAAPPPDVVCGTPGVTWNANDLENTECTHHLGSVHVSEQGDLRWLSELRVVDGSLTFFRNDGVTSMRGLEQLEYVGGDFGISHHAMLSDLDALETLTSVGGDFYAHSNRVLHDAEAHALAMRIEIGGTVEISGNAQR